MARNASVTMWPEIGEPKQINMDGNVIIKSTAQSGQARVLETEQARMDFTEGTENHPGQPKRAETLAAGTIQWMDAQEKSGNNAAYTKLRADKIRARFYRR